MAMLRRSERGMQLPIGKARVVQEKGIMVGAQRISNSDLAPKR